MPFKTGATCHPWMHVKTLFSRVQYPTENIINTESLKKLPCSIWDTLPSVDVSQKRYFSVSVNNITSMFVERMEVLEYRQKFEVELSTFPDSTNTETPRKLVFSLTCVCVWVCLSVRPSVCVCEKVCQWISYERVD